MTWTQTILDLKDANGVTQPVIAYTDGTNFSFAHPLLDNTGAIISPATAGNQVTANTALTAIEASAAASATSALQTTGNTLLTEIEASLAGTLAVSGTVGVSASALPTGAATSAAQTTGNTSLASIAVSTANIPASPSTSALQTTGNTSLATIATAVQAATPAGTNIIGKVGIDQTTPGTTNGVQVNAALPTGTNTIGAVSAGVNVITGNTTTRPANTTTYSFSTLVANSTSAGSVVASTIAAAKGVNIPTAAIRCRLQASGTVTTNAIFRVHFWNAAPTVTNGDGGAFVANFDNTYCGSFDVTCGLGGSASVFGIGAPTNGPAMVFTPASGTSNLYYLIEARAAYTPTSGEVFTPYLEIQ